MSAKFRSRIATLLLAWYDANARVLPWRAPPGAPPMDPYRVWLSEIMLQQTQVASVIPYFERFTARWGDVAALAAADEGKLMAAWAGLGYYARARNLLACAREVAGAKGGRFPQDEAELRALPGIGAYTAAAIAAIAFGQRAVVVDGNVERVVARLFAVETPMPGAKAELRALADSITPERRAGDFAQAMMDLGATVCTPRSPDCAACPLAGGCAARIAGAVERYPIRAAKRVRPVRHATLFWLEHEAQVLLVRRPAKGLLGGMLALPSGEWGDAPPGLMGAPVLADWRIADAEHRHIFTHFTLSYRIALAQSEGACEAAGEWWPIARLDGAGLPSLFARAAEWAIQERSRP